MSCHDLCKGKQLFDTGWGGNGVDRMCVTQHYDYKLHQLAAYGYMAMWVYGYVGIFLVNTDDKLNGP